MPCGRETEESLQSKRIERDLKAQAPKILAEIKLLLLGTGESGKSTIAKQMKIMHLNGFSPKERETYKVIIHNNIVESASTLVNQSKIFGFEIQDSLRDLADRFASVPADISGFVNAETAKGIAELWRDNAIQQTYERRSEFQLPGSVDHIMSNVERLLSTSVELTEDDILRCRMRTTGIIEIEFSVSGTDFRMVDVGGQRSERKKWFHCFAQVTAVIFCVALNEYDEKLYEDERVNRMVEALNLFEEVVNSKFFNDPIHNTHIVLFLNKSDLFRDKIKKVPLTTLFPRYKGGDDFDAGTKYIKKKFTEKSKDQKKLIFTHVTTATDTENVRRVFSAVQTSILHNNLRGVGMV